MVPTSTEDNPLAALAVRLELYGLTTHLTATGLHVMNPKASGCCDEVRHPADRITCARRSAADGGGGRWFWTSWREPLAPVHSLDEALVRIRANLARVDHDRAHLSELG
ncbi:hypothetical protein [Actinomadura rupiterrae]|uniref:hypothetical protein n=1 Tax=Actinomadura rupiterrae TaxID=559627 RepID=UPI0020A42160|nr:hypothetical protein [Actinomadura rupiterrae]MCP2340473.1 hypothetical protein [Actinomadura rupiterrae]